jgi:hypothetical protein
MGSYNIKNILKNFYYKPQISFIKTKFKLLKKKKVLVIGSGPSAELKNYILKDYVVICCNGSANVLKENNQNITPYLTIIDNELIDHTITYEKDVRSIITKNKLLKNLNLGNLISVQSNHSKHMNPNILEANFKSFTYINKNFRRTLLNNLLNTNFIENDNDSLVSTGIFSICLGFLFGASEVEFTGFSLWDNEQYYSFNKNFVRNITSSTATSKNESISSKKLTRNHSLADSLCIALLKVKKFKVYTKDKDFLPLMTNWGTI